MALIPKNPPPNPLISCFFVGFGRALAIFLDMYFTFSQNNCVSADLDEARSCSALFAAVSRAVHINVAANLGRSLHFFTLYEAAVIAVFNEAVEITVVGKSSVGGACCSLFVDILERSKVSHMAGFTLFAAAIQSECVNTYDRILL